MCDLLQHCERKHGAQICSETTTGLEKRTCSTKQSGTIQVAEDMQEAKGS
jgi:hypothetical protein